MTTTATTPLSTVIGVFLDHDQANSAIDALRHASFGYNRIRLVEHGTGGFVDTLKGMFTGQASMASSTAESLIKMGMPDYEAQHYQSELDANHVLLLMNANDRPEEAFNIMRQNGAFDLNLRLRMTPENSAGEARTFNGSQETRQPAMQAAAYPTTPQYTTPNTPMQAAAYPEAAPYSSGPTSQPEEAYGDQEAIDPSKRSEGTYEAQKATDSYNQPEGDYEAQEAADAAQRPAGSYPNESPAAFDPTTQPVTPHSNGSQETLA